MADRSQQRRARATPSRRPGGWLIWTIAIVGVVGVAALAILLSAPRSGGQVAWARFDTQDVHALSFVGEDADHLLFGHHGGLLETRDEGRTWRPLATSADAMSLRAAGDGSIVIAGHEVFSASRDGGATWAPIATDLPSLDIHGFARDPLDPARMWAYLATGGLWESSDSGGHFVRVREDNVLFPLAVSDAAGSRLLGVDASGFVASTDGGRSWATLGSPPAFPMTSLAATPDGGVVYAGSPDGLFRSRDGGRTFSATTYLGSAFAVANDGRGRGGGGGQPADRVLPVP